jgi:hypothetical protein
MRTVKRFLAYVGSTALHISRMECMESCGLPRSEKMVQHELGISGRRTACLTNCAHAKLGAQNGPDGGAAHDIIADGKLLQRNAIAGGQLADECGRV